MLVFSKYFNLNLISSKTGINKDKLYNNFKQDYNKDTLTDDNKKEISSVLVPATKEMFERLGLKVDFQPIE